MRGLEKYAWPHACAPSRGGLFWWSSFHDRLVDGGDGLLHASPLVAPLQKLGKHRIVVLFHELAQRGASLFIKLREASLCFGSSESFS